LLGDQETKSFSDVESVNLPAMPLHGARKKMREKAATGLTGKLPRTLGPKMGSFDGSGLIKLPSGNQNNQELSII